MNEMNQERKRLFDQLLASNKNPQVLKVPFRNRKSVERIPVVQVPTEDLRYNIRLGRLILDRYTTLQVEGDPEDPQTQRLIEQQILALPETMDLKRELEADGQLEPGITTEDGYLVNGNRRLACIRTLEAQTGDPRFRYMDVGVLPKASPDELFLLEATLQMTPESRARYGPVTEAVNVRRGLVDYHLQKLVVAQAMHLDEEELDKKLEILALIDSYLAFVNRQGEYHLVENRPGTDEAQQGKWWIFEAIHGMQKRHQTDPRWEAFLQHLFLLVRGGTTMDEMRRLKGGRRLNPLDIYAAEIARTAVGLRPAADPPSKPSGDSDLDALAGEVTEIRAATEGQVVHQPIPRPDPTNLDGWSAATKAAQQETFDTMANLHEKEAPSRLLSQALKKLDSVDFAGAAKANAVQSPKERFKKAEAGRLLAQLATRIKKLETDLTNLTS
jgi:hypothetical protein